MRLASLVAGLFVTVSGTLFAQLTITTDPSQLFGSVGQTYSKQLSATGGSGQYQWFLVTGNLPPVLSLDQNKGVIAGIPNAGGTFSFTVKVVDLSTQLSSAKQLSIGILQISTPSPLPNATLNTPYSVTFGVTDGPQQALYHWQLVESAPPGLTFDNAQGILSGTPTVAGPYSFTVMAFNDPTSTSATKSFTLTVSGAGAITITPSLPSGDVNSPYQVMLAATGGKAPYRWAVTTGALPDGLTLDPNTGNITGTPITPGPSSFTIVATDSANNSSAPKLFSITINPALVITNSSPLQSGTVGSAFSLAFVAMGGATPYMFTSQASPFNPNLLPPGLTLSTGGVLSGTPTMQGTYNFTIFLTDATGTQVTKPFTQTINPALTFQTPAQLPAGMIGVNYSQTITATGGTPPYVYSAANPPPGLTLLGSANVGAVLSGTPTAIGTFPFDVVVTDNQKVSTTRTFQLSVTSAPPMLAVAPLTLDFAAAVDGDSPASQKIDINSVGPQPAAFTIVIDGGAGIAAPPWISVNLRSGLTPARVVVSVDQAKMPAGKYSARILINDASQNTLPVLVTLTVSNVAPKFEIVPDVLKFSALIEAPGTFEQVLAVRNAGGGGPLTFSTSVLGGSSWVTTVTPSSGQTARNTLVFLRVRVSTAGVAIGSYHEFISFSWAGGTVNVPITLFVADRGPIIGVNITGVRLQARQGGGFSNIPVVKVLNLGDPASTVNWLAELVTGSDFLTLAPARGTASATNPGLLTIVPQPGATQMAPGGYYALIRISDPQSRNSPAYVIVVFDLANAAAPPLPDPSPAGLFFIGAANGTPPLGQIVTVNTSSATAVPFQAAALSADGANWLSVNPSSGTSTGQSPGQVTVTVKTTGLPPGVYSGEVTVSMSGALRTVMVTFIVLPAGSSTPTGSAVAATPSAGCSPSQLALTQTGLVNSFSQPASWPAALIAQLNDDCGALVDNGAVVASFSNGDSPLTLRRAGQPGMYAATWQPGVVSPQMAITIRAVAGALQPASIQLIGHIDPNNAPVLFKNGTVNVFNRVTAGALAPGMIVEVYGSGLASAVANPGVLPLPNLFNNTYVLVGPYQAPLYFLSDGQLDVQINTELTPTQQFPIVVSANGRLTLPDMLDVVPVQLGIAHFDDGHIIAQHGADFSYVDAAHPAKPNEVLVIYLSGMGPTDPAVKSGDPSPVTEPLARVTLKPTVMVDGQDASVQFAGLTPGFVGLYQMNFQVPGNAKSGDLNLVVIQNGVSSNTTKLPVAQ